LVSGKVSTVAAAVSGEVLSLAATVLGAAVVGAEDELLLPQAAATAPASVNRATARTLVRRAPRRRVRGVAIVDMIGRQYPRIPTTSIAFTEMWNIVPPIDKLRLIR
jgi:hypothetical protein